MRVPMANGRDERQIKIAGADDAWMLRDVRGSGYIVIADGITVAIGEATPESAVATAMAFVQTEDFITARSKLRFRVGYKAPDAAR